MKRRTEKQAVPTIAIPIKSQCATPVPCTHSKGDIIMGLGRCNPSCPIRHKLLPSRPHGY